MINATSRTYRFFTSGLLLAVLVLAGSDCRTVRAADRPNILWITSEDNSAFWLGCYGNEQAQTPVLDQLAGEGVKFTQAFSNGPVCAVARSTLLNGIYAPALGTQHMRSRYPVPKQIKPYVSYLREAGYYCTNNSKTDYNQAGNDAALWDECSGKAHYKHCPEGKPFFAIFNLLVTHESKLFPENVDRQRKQGIIPETPRLALDQVQVPECMPDLPESRSDVAIYHDLITALDTQVGELLSELKKAGHADDTIVFYYSDHGGATARGKRYLTNSGENVPLIVYFPPKWQHLSPFAAGSEANELVGFVDFGPTLISLCDLEKPSQMMGRPFLGTHREAAPADDVAFVYSGRFDGRPGMRRGITDGRYTYVRRFMPYLPEAPLSLYSLSQPAWKAWEQAWEADELTGYYKQLWEPNQEVEVLIDNQNDPWQLHNLASDPAHAEKLAAMRSRLKQKMAEVRDTGVVSELLFTPLTGGQPMYTYVRSDECPYDQLLDLAFTASQRDPSALPQLIEACEASHPAIKYWGALGCVVLGEQAAEARPQLTALLDDEQGILRFTAAHALAKQGDQHAKELLIHEFDNKLSDLEQMYLLSAVVQLKLEDQIPQRWIDKQLKDSAHEHLNRAVKYLVNKKK